VRTLKLTLAYDGTRFVGWQRQAEGVSIQGLLEDALARLEGGPVTVHGAGRTDAGVHALGQVASAQLTSAHPVDVVARALNACLPPELRVISVEQVADDFHARFSARSKTYRYVIRNAAIVSPFERAYVWHLSDALDREAMRQGAAAVVGTHDFAAFRSVGGEVKTTVRTIVCSEFVGRTLSGAPDEPRPTSDEQSPLVYEITGDGFLRHMVRAIVGTLVEIGRGQRPAASMAALLASGSRAEAGATAPPQGLFLVRVDYDRPRSVA
jgi:tRNA pseudouridine38-40 synthase